MLNFFTPPALRRAARAGRPGPFVLLVLLLALGLAGHAQTAPAWQSAFAPTQLAGGASVVRATAVNAAGDAFVTGRFTGTVSFGSTRLTSAGGSDVFVAKWDATAQAFAWAVRGGGTGADEGTGIAVSGPNVYVTGYFISGASARLAGQVLVGAGSQDMFAAKYVDNGATVADAWATSGGGGSTDVGTGIAVSGPNVYAVGYVAPPATFGTIAIGSTTSGEVNFLAALTDSAPLLISLSASSGPAGSSLTLTGSNLTGTTAVTFTGSATNAVTTGLTVSGMGSAQTLTVTVPSGAATGSVTVTTPNGTSNGLTFGVVLLAATAVRKTQVLAYPNPAHGTLTVLRPAGAAATGVLLNSLGQVVRTLALPTAETTLDLRGLASGVYTLRLTVAGQPLTRRVVLE